MVQAPIRVAGREVHIGIGAGRDNIELGIKYVDTVYHAIQAGHGKCRVGLVLPHTVTGAGDLLVGRGDNEIRCVHGDQVSRELRREMILLVIVSPVEV